MGGTLNLDLWRDVRHAFPVTGRFIYLHHAGVAPLCRPAADAMKHLADDALHAGSVHYGDWMAAYDGLRAAAARLINAEPGEIAIVKNTSEGIATVAMGIDWKPGDIVVAFREEFPANFYPWKRLEARGVEVRWLSCEAPLDEIEQSARGARLLAISYVQYLSGHRVDLNAIGAICKRHGVFFFVDAIQGLGVFPLDVRAAHIDALAADGHKWLLGPEGCGILYVRREAQDSIEPVEFGWTNTARHADYASRDMTLRPDAGRYEPGTLNTIGIFGLRASIEFILSIGVANIGPVARHYGDLIVEGVTAKGYEVLGSRTPATGSPIVSFRKPGLEPAHVVRGLKDHGVIAAPRQGWVRMSPHFYLSPDEIARAIDLLP